MRNNVLILEEHNPKFVFLIVSICRLANRSRPSRRSKAEMATKTKVPAFDSVITMLQNLISQIDTELASDETDYGNFMSWSTGFFTACK